MECDGQKVNEILYPELAALMPNTPNYKGRFLQGTDTNTKVGDKIEAGLPNIKGEITIPTFIQGGLQFIINGCFKREAKSFMPRHAAKHDPDDYPYFLHSFDAARSNSIYGKSTTVQPPAVTVKYIIKAE